MREKFKTFSRITQLTIILALILSVGIVAYAAINSWISKRWTSTFTKGDVMEMELNQSSVTGEVVPGQSLPISPTIKNVGTKQVLAFVKVEMPVYTFTADESMWTKVADDGAMVVYGYGVVLSPDDETVTALCERPTMVEMSGSEFLGMSDVNVKLTGYLADVKEYGEDFASVRSKIRE